VRTSWAGWIAALGLPASVTAVVVVSARLTAGQTGYDPVHSSLSRLGAAGRPGARAFAVALAGVAVALLVASPSAARGRLAGASLAAAGVLLLLAAAVPVGRGVDADTAFHRACVGACLAALVLAAVIESRRLGWVALAIFAAGLGLLVPGFPAGIWERLLFGLLLVWVEVVLLRRLAQKRAGKFETSAAS
jgi:hypothetical protein